MTPNVYGHNSWSTLRVGNTESSQLVPRSPRLRPSQPTGCVKVNSPNYTLVNNTVSPGLGLSPLALLLPVAGMLVAVALFYFLGKKSLQGGGIYWLLMSIPMLFGSYGVTFILMYRNKRANQARADAQRDQYLRHLDQVERTLQGGLQEWRRIWAEDNPPPERLAVVSVQDIWRRSPPDDDFLRVRVGVTQGQAPLYPCWQSGSGDTNTDTPIGQRLTTLFQRYNHVADLPVTVDLHQPGITLLTGDLLQVEQMANALLLQLLAHHAPGDIRLALVAPTRLDWATWQWLRWVPQMWDTGKKERWIATNEAACRALASRLAETARNRQASDPYTIVLISPQGLTCLLNHPLLSIDMPEGLHIIALAPTGGRVPHNVVQTITLLGADGYMEPQRITFVPDYISTSIASQFAHQLAPLYTSSTLMQATRRKATLLSLVHAEPHTHHAFWQRHPVGEVEAAIGTRDDGAPLKLDLHESRHGPHLLVAGTTGAGKSILLQTLILSLAANYAPGELQVAIIDFKGGELADPLRQLPHLTSVLTNLDSASVARALTALRSEMETRQRLIRDASVGHIDAYFALRRTRHDLRPVPRLLLVVDEFAELKEAYPDLMREMVAVARLGRSLGLHLVLATQRPAGIVNAQILSNLRSHICLRVATTDDSREVLGRPDAAYLEHSGEALFQVGGGTPPVAFQVAYAAAPLQDSRRDQVLAIVAPDGSREPLLSQHDDTTTEGEYLITELVKAAAGRNYKLPLSPLWLPPLPSQISIRESTNDTAPADQPGVIIGILDYPKTRRQTWWTVDDTAGPLVIYGAPGMGKSTALRTLAKSMAMRGKHTLYVIEGRRKGELTDLAQLTATAAVVSLDDQEGVRRMFQAVMQPGTHSNDASPVLLIDDLPQFIQSVSTKTTEALLALLATQSLFIVMTANAPRQVMARVQSMVQQVIALHLSDRNDYLLALGYAEHRLLPKTPGRAFWRHPKDAIIGQIAWTAPFRTQLDYGYTAPPLPRMVEQVDITSTALTAAKGHVVVGTYWDNLQPVEIALNDGPHFLVLSPMQGGKTTLLSTWLHSLEQNHRPEDIAVYMAAEHGNPLLQQAGQSSLVRGIAMDGEELAALIEELANSLVSDQSQPPYGTLLLLDDGDLIAHLSASAGDVMERLIRHGRRAGFHLVMTTTTSDVSSRWEGWLKALRETRTGFVLNTNAPNDLAILTGGRIIASEQIPLQPGDGYLVRHGVIKAIRVAVSPYLPMSSRPSARPARKQPRAKAERHHE